MASWGHLGMKRRLGMESQVALPCAFMLGECDMVSMSRVGSGLYRREMTFSLCPGHSDPSACGEAQPSLSALLPLFPSPQTGLKTSWPGSGLLRSGLA